MRGNDTSDTPRESVRNRDVSQMTRNFPSSNNFLKDGRFYGRKRIKDPAAPFLIWWMIILAVATVCYVSS